MLLESFRRNLDRATRELGKKTGTEWHVQSFLFERAEGPEPLEPRDQLLYLDGRSRPVGVPAVIESTRLHCSVVGDLDVLGPSVRGGESILATPAFDPEVRSSSSAKRPVVGIVGFVSRWDVERVISDDVLHTIAHKHADILLTQSDLADVSRNPVSAVSLPSLPDQVEARRVCSPFRGTWVEFKRGLFAPEIALEEAERVGKLREASETYSRKLTR